MTARTRLAMRISAGVALLAGAAFGAVLAGVPLGLSTEASAPGDMPVQAASGPQGAGLADAFLVSVRGIAPLACDFVFRGLDNYWGHRRVAPVLFAEGQQQNRRQVLDWALTRPHGTAAIGPLRDGLASADACERRVSARLLGEIRHPSVLEILNEALEASDPNTRQAAALALGYSERPDAVEPLRNILVSASVELRRAAAWALGRIERPEAISDLVSALGDPDAPVRANAAWALGQIEDSEAIPSLVALLASDSDNGVRKVAAWALGQIE